MKTAKKFNFTKLFKAASNPKQKSINEFDDSVKKVLAFGTFDIFHPGHEFYLKKAKSLGDMLYVIISRDETVKKVKGQFPDFDEKKRQAKISYLNYVDKAILGNNGEDKLKLIEDINPDVICLGYDQNFFTESLKEELEKRGVYPEIVRAESFNPEEHKSSKLRMINS